MPQSSSIPWDPRAESSRISYAGPTEVNVVNTFLDSLNVTESHTDAYQ